MSAFSLRITPLTLSKTIVPGILTPKFSKESLAVLFSLMNFFSSMRYFPFILSVSSILPFRSEIGPSLNTLSNPVTSAEKNKFKSISGDLKLRIEPERLAMPSGKSAYKVSTTNFASDQSSNLPELKCALSFRFLISLLVSGFIRLTSLSPKETSIDGNSIKVFPFTEPSN